MNDISLPAAGARHAAADRGERDTIVLAGGCFWCLEAVYDQVEGVTDVESGYSNGHVPRPSYEQVCAGTTGHAEVVKLEFDPRRIGLADLLDIFFSIHDPTTLNRQGNDVGPQYRSGIYTTAPRQAELARAKIAEWQPRWGAPIVTEVAPLANYHPAEDYHQDYFEKNPFNGYCMAVAAPKVEKLRRHFPAWTRR